MLDNPLLHIFMTTFKFKISGNNVDKGECVLKVWLTDGIVPCGLQMYWA